MLAFTRTNAAMNECDLNDAEQYIVRPNISSDAVKQVGYLYTAGYVDGDLNAMSEDMYEAQLLNGVLVWAGWYETTYLVATQRGCKVIAPYATTDIYDAAREIERRVEVWRG